MQHWPPRHKNTLVSPNNAGSVIATVATGTTTQLLAAPPAGYAWLISSWNVVNDDAALTLAYELTEDGNLVDGRAMTAAQIASPGGGLGLTGALSMAVTGAGTSVTISLSYYRVRLTDFVMWRLALTDTFQAVAAIVPPVGRASKFTSLNTGFSTLSVASPMYILNNDSASTTVQVKITRGATIITRTNGAVAANASRTTFSALSLPNLLPGDLVEIKAIVAPVTADKVVVGGMVNLVPLLAA